MRKKLTLILVRVLVLAQLCACGKPQADAPAAESEPAVQPDEPVQAVQEEPEPEPADLHVPDRVLTSKHYSAEIYENTIRQYNCSIESRGDGPRLPRDGHRRAEQVPRSYRAVGRNHSLLGHGREQMGLGAAGRGEIRVPGRRDRAGFRRVVFHRAAAHVHPARK